MPARAYSLDDLEVVLDSYLHMARATAENGRDDLSDKFLVLAALFAERAGHLLVAESCRQQLVKRRPHHLFDGHRSVSAALQSPIVQEYVQRLETLYPPAKTDYLLHRYRSQGYHGPHGFEEMLPPRRVKRVPQGKSKRKSGTHRRQEDAEIAHAADVIPLPPIPFESPFEQAESRQHRIVVRVAVLACVVGVVLGVVVGLYLRSWLAH